MTAVPPAADPVGFQYVALRCVPRVDREEFLNVGVIVYSQAADFLRAATRLTPQRLHALDSRLDLDAVRSALDLVEAVCSGAPAAGAAAGPSLGQRFGWLTAPRSTVLQPSPIHGGLTRDPQAELDRLLHRLV